MKRFIIKNFNLAKNFMLNDVWDIEITSLSTLRAFGVKFARVIHLVFRGFREDECPLHASALTFFTLMAIVPILALSLALARVFDGADLAENRIRSVVSEFTSRIDVHSVATNSLIAKTPGSIEHRSADMDEQSDVMSPQELALKLDTMLDKGFAQVEQIRFKALGGIGLVLLLWMVITVLGRVESTFNRVWGVKDGRNLLRKCSDYLSVVIILPFLVIMASSLPVVSFATRFLHEPLLSSVKAFMVSGLLKNIMVILMSTLSFAFLIVFMPNTKVNGRSALVGGLISALLFIGWLWFCASIQVGVARYGKIYGSFAIVPIVLAWVYVSWEIVLFGAELAFAVQNCATYQMEQGARSPNMESKIMLALSVVIEAGRAMSTGSKRFQLASYAGENGIPVRFLNGVIDELVSEGFLAKLSDTDDSYVLLRAPESIRVKDVIDALMNAGVKPDNLGLNYVDSKIQQVVKTTADRIGGSVRESTIKEMIVAA